MADHILIEEKRTHWEVTEVQEGSKRTTTRKKYLEDAITLAVLWMQENRDSGFGNSYAIQVKFLD